MSKKRKTKKQKIAAINRHDFSNMLTFTNTSGVRIENIEKPILQRESINTQTSHSYTYVTRDIKNTLTVTSILVAINLLIYFLLKIGLIKLFGIVF